MAFENMTALELHLHFGDEPEGEQKQPARRIERPTEDEQTSRLPKPILLFLIGLVVSLTVSALVTLVVKRFKSGDGDD